MRYELTDYEWATIKPFLPNKVRGVPRVNDRRVRRLAIMPRENWSTLNQSLIARTSGTCL